MKPLTGKNAIVTGAGRGIGAAVALALAEAGANVAINDYGPDNGAQQVAEQCRELGVKARVCVADVGNQAAVEQMVRETVADFGGLQIAVSNAAFSDRQPFYAADMAGFEKTMQVTMWGAFYVLRAVTQHMLATETAGSMVVVSSSHSWRPVPNSMAYNMAKAAVDQMAKTAATELCAHRIRVNIVHPGWTDTPGERKFCSDEVLQSKAADLPWGRLARPDEIARAVLFFCDPASDYLTGSSLLVDGGKQLPVPDLQRSQIPPDVE